jgi:hypothetical protein
MSKLLSATPVTIEHDARGLKIVPQSGSAIRVWNQDNGAEVTIVIPCDMGLDFSEGLLAIMRGEKTTPEEILEL